METFAHITPVQIRFNDVDIMGHVNNAVHQHYYDYARLEFFREVFGETIDWDRQALVLAAITVDYLEPIQLDDKVEVRTWITRIGNKSLNMSQEIMQAKTGSIKSKSNSVLVGYNRLQGETITIPTAWKERISFYCDVKI